VFVLSPVQPRKNNSQNESETESRSQSNDALPVHEEVVQKRDGCADGEYNHKREHKVDEN